MWSDAIELIKYSGKRGASVAPLMEDSETGLRLTEVKFSIVFFFLKLQSKSFVEHKKKIQLRS